MGSLEATWLVTPIWLIAMSVYVGMIVAAFIGWRLHKRSKVEETSRTSSEEGYVVSSVMALLALLIGFTFSLAVDRFDSRRQMVIEEANAIGTTYLRTQLLEEPHRTRISELLARYTENRLTLSHLEADEGQENLLAQNDAISADLWSATRAAFPSVQTRPLSSAYINSMNAVFDMDAARQQARRSHVPAEVLLLLIAYQFIASGVLGYALVGRRGRITAALLLLLYGSSLVLVIDLDRPNRGGIRESQLPMELLMETIRAHPSGSYDRFLSVPEEGAE